MTPRLPGPETVRREPWNIGRRLALAVAVLALAVLALALVRFGVFYSFYTWLLYQTIDLTGYDVWLGRAIALALVSILWFLPWHLLVLPWIGSPGRRALVFFALTALALAAMELITRDVYFSRHDGRPLKYYVQTLEGFRLAASPGTDPAYGLPYRPITQEVAKHYILWKKRGGEMQDPALPAGQYFSPATGDALRWYARSPDGQIEMFTLPGFHPKYGTRLEPATVEIVTEYEAQQQEAARRRQEEAQHRTEQESAVRQQTEAALQDQPLPPGRYLFAGPPQPVGTVDGLRFTLTEVDLTADTMLLHLGVENVGVPPEEETTDDPITTVRIGLVRADGETAGYSAIRPKEGALSQLPGSFGFPRRGERGAFVMEFPASAGERQLTFSLTVNDQPLLAAINLREAAFRSF